MKNYFTNNPAQLFDDCAIVADNGFVRAYQVKIRAGQKIKYKLKDALIYNFKGDIKLEVISGSTTVEPLPAKSAVWIDNNFVCFIGGNEVTDLVIMEAKRLGGKL